MKHAALLVCAGALLAGGAAGGYYGVQALAPNRAPLAPDTADAERASSPLADGRSSEPADMLPAALPLAWSDLLEPGAVLAPSARARALAGQRVRLVGFMAQLELPIRGAFYLVPQPLTCDEAGAGTADLLPSSVLVLSESAAGKDVAFVPGALDVSGVFEVGNQAGADGRVSAFRLRLDRGPAIAPVQHAGPPNISG